MPAIDINRWMLSLLAELQASRQRQLLSLQGPREWCDRQLRALHDLEPDRLLLSDRHEGDSVLPLRRAQAWLGSESRLVVVDLFDAFDPDAVCIAAGLVQDAGVLLLLSPPPRHWDLARDRLAGWQGRDRSPRAHFVDYFFDALAQDEPCLAVLTPESGDSAIPRQAQLTPTLLAGGLSADQAEALQRIEQWLARESNAVFLLDADRGRGKSTCLGHLCNRLGAKSDLRVLLSAGSKRAAAKVAQVAPGIEFVAPDRLLRDRPAADLVVIDEAAMIPLALLRQICEAYPRVVLATTTGGYEGTGRGFMLRFVAGLEAQRLSRFSLAQPVRWCSGDRLEAWINRVLMLNPDDNATTGQASAEASIEIRLLAEPAAAPSTELLCEVYALLSSAHYRTRPSDLRMLMENPAQRIIVATAGARLVGAMLLNFEGGFDDDLCQQVYLGRRRPRGHLLAQMLTAQAGIEDFARLRGLRIVRIAVAESWRRRRVGSRMLDQALAFARASNCDYLGASFALDAETIAFWRHHEFVLAHVSFAAGKSSGEHSIAVLRALETSLEPQLRRLQRRLQRQLPVWLTQFLQTLDAAQVWALLGYADYRAELDADELAEIDAFATGQRGFELCFASLQRYVMQALAQADKPPEPLLVEKAIQNRDWGRLRRDAGSVGRRQLQQGLRRLVEALRKA